MSTAPPYLFSHAPPAKPQLYFAESKLLEMAIWGTAACPWTPPQYTIFPSDGQVGRWTLRFEVVNPLTDESPWKLKIADFLPGMRMHYEDFDNGQQRIWVLTDQIIRAGEPEFRLGVWPD